MSAELNILINDNNKLIMEVARLEKALKVSEARVAELESADEEGVVTEYNDTKRKINDYIKARSTKIKQLDKE